MKKLLALLLALVMILSVCLLVACDGDDDTSTDTPDKKEEDSGKEDPGEGDSDSSNRNGNPDEIYWDNITKTKNYDGDQVTIMSNAGGFTIKEDTEMNDGDVVQYAQYTRQHQIEDRFGVTLYEIPDISSSDCMKNLSTDVGSNTGAYDIVGGHAKFDASAALLGYCLDLTRLEDLDLTQDYWNEFFTQTWGYKDKVWWTTGDIVSTSYLGQMVGTYFNKELFTSNFPNDDLYALINEGGWTLAKAKEYVDTFGYIDQNGNAMMDDADIFGWVSTNGWSISSLGYSAGFTLTKLEGSKHVFDLTSQSNESRYKALRELVQSTYFRKITALNVGEAVELHALFSQETIDGLEGMRASNIQVGIVPCPKYTAEEEYITSFYDGIPCMGVDAVISKDRYEEVGIVMEALAAAGKKLITEAYFDVAISTKATKSEEDYNMLKIIRSHAKVDFAFAWCQALPDIDTFVGDTAEANVASIATKWAIKESFFNDSLKKMYANMKSVATKQDDN